MASPSSSRIHPPEAMDARERRHQDASREHRSERHERHRNSRHSHGHHSDRHRSSHNHKESSGDDRDDRRHRHRHGHRQSRSRSPDHRERRHDSQKRHDRHRDDASESRRDRHSRHLESDKRQSRRKEGRVAGDKVRIEDDDEETRGQTEQFAELNEYTSQDATASIPTSQSMGLRSKATASNHTTNGAEMPRQPGQETQIRRDDWMLSMQDQASVQGEHGVGRGDRPAQQTDDDFFSSLGGQGRQLVPKADKPNPDQLYVSSRELNTQFAQGKHIDEYEDPRAKKAAEPKLGGPGHQWRMMKLRRVYEAAEDEDRSIEEVALERYGTMEAFNEARAERQYLDDQQSQRGSGQRQPGSSASGSQTSSRAATPKSSGLASRPLSRQSSSFRKPGEASGASTPQQSRPSALRQSSTLQESDRSKPSTPVPSVFAPTVPNTLSAKPSTASSDSATTGVGSKQAVTDPPLDAAALNKLSAKVMRAEMMNAPDAAELRQRLEAERARAESGGDKGLSAKSEHFTDGQAAAGSVATQVQVLPTLDARGRLYDVGKGGASEDADGKRKRKEKFETRDPKTGELLRYNADDDEQTLADLVREEKYTAGMASQKNMDAEFASRIMGDKSFKADVDYLDDNVERMARKKMKSDALKRQFAINDFARTKKALDTCTFCWQDDSPPKATIVSSGTRAYLAVPDTEPFVPGHCLIVPMQHHLSMLEADEDTCEEVKNFMKCLIQMSAAQQKGVVFFETVKSLKAQRHTVIEAMPIEESLFAALPTYFRQSILDAGEEWSQNKKLIAFSAERPFRNAMVPQLPYFMVQFDHRGYKGFGHVIEAGDGFEADDNGESAAGDLGSRGGSGTFPHWFAAEVIGNLLEYEPRQWRKPRRLGIPERQEQRMLFKQQWDKYDWTPMLQQAQAQ